MNTINQNYRGRWEVYFWIFVFALLLLGGAVLYRGHLVNKAQQKQAEVPVETNVVQVAAVVYVTNIVIKTVEVAMTNPETKFPEPPAPEPIVVSLIEESQPVAVSSETNEVKTLKLRVRPQLGKPVTNVAGSRQQ